MDHVIKKIILFRNTRHTSEFAIGRLFAGYLALSEELSGLDVMVGGAIQSINPLSQGFTHGLIFSFSGQKAFDHYMTNSKAENLNRQATKLFHYPQDVLIMNLPVKQSCMDEIWEQEASAS